jgi:hypothetical protein
MHGPRPQGQWTRPCSLILSSKNVANNVTPQWMVTMLVVVVISVVLP